MDHHDGSSGETTTMTDLTARRPDVLRRLLERGVPATTLQTILPEWEPFLAAALTEAPAAR